MNKYVKEMHEACLEAVKECREIKALVLNLINRDEVKNTILIEENKRAEIAERIKQVNMQVQYDMMRSFGISTPLSDGVKEESCQRMTPREVWAVGKKMEQELKKQEPINPSSIDVDVSSLLGD